MRTTAIIAGANRSQGGFTLLEATIVLGIICILGALGMSGAQSAIASARKLKEIQAARSLIQAHAAATAESNEVFSGMDERVKKFVLPNGKTASPDVVGQRYAYRLLPYLGGNLEDTILVGKNKSQIDSLTPEGAPFREYVISAFPAFGINTFFVGGYYNSDGSVRYPDECVRTRGQMDCRILVFASAASRSEMGGVDGFNTLYPPRLTTDRWSQAPKWNKSIDPGVYGYVDARYDGMAICAFLDGSVEMHSIDDLRDMRLWSRNAAEQGDSEYLIPQ